MEGTASKTHPFLTVSVDGTVASTSDDDHAGGALMSLRHGGIDLLDRYTARDVLQASTPLPPRMLLSYAVQSLKDRRMGALAAALVHAMVALLPVLLGACLLDTMGASKEFVQVAFVGVMIWVMVRAFLKEIRAPERAWRLSEWVDFERRTWNARKSFLDGALPDRTASAPLDELTLVCFVHQWEQSDSYDVGLCKRTELDSCERGDPAILNVIHSSPDEKETHEFARALAALWGIDCWGHRYDLGMRKYCKFRV